MYEKLASDMLVRMDNVSKHKRYCLPYTKALLDFFSIRGISARPLVARAVVFNIEGVSGGGVSGMAGDLNHNELCEEAISLPKANGDLTRAADSGEQIKIPYRTIGFPLLDGDREMGTYSQGGTWLGHLVALVNDMTAIDLTISQLNSTVYKIRFFPPYL